MTLRFLTTALLAVCASATCLAQSTLDRAILASNAPLTGAQKTAVGEFIAPMVDTIAKSNDMGALDEARWTLASVARDPAATAQFRRAYGESLAEALTPVVKGKDLRRSINAMQVLRFTRSTDGLDVLVASTAPDAEAEAGKRISAASLIADSFEDLEASSTYVETVARRLRDACASETDPIALQRKLAAMGAAARRKDLTPENVRTIRRYVVDAMSTLIKSMKNSAKADARIGAFQRALLGVRNELLDMPAAERSAIFRALAPVLVDLLGAVNNQWDSAHADADLAGSYASVTNSCEVLLRLIDRSERASAYTGSAAGGDQRTMAAAWESKDKKAFDAELKRWKGIVAAAPYKG
ncbi:MAG: hypothetical protein ACO31E_08945 [Phycisphaerales bacterium]|jgi:hypothetical protein